MSGTGSIESQRYYTNRYSIPAMTLRQRLQFLSRFPVLVGHRFVEDNCLNLAGSLTFTTLLSLVPLLTIALTVIAAFPVFQQITQGVDDFFAQNVLPPALAKTVTRYVTEFTQSAGRLTAFGIVFLAATAIMLMMTIERAFNVIWQVKRPRPIVFRILTYWAVLTIGPLLIGLSITMTSYLVSMSVGIVKQVPGGPNILLGLVSILLTATAFTLMYFVVPNRPIDLKHALVGGFAAAILFEGMKRGFALYIAKFPSYTLVYGAFASVPIFLIWLYLSWVIALLGAVITALLPSRRMVRDPSELRASAAFRDALEILRVLVVAQRASRTPRTREIYADVQLSYETGDRLLDDLTAAGWIARVVGDRWTLACDPDVVTVADVYRRLVFRSAGRSEPRPGLDAVIERATAAVDEALAVPIRTLAG
jgi:membrane protein